MKLALLFFVAFTTPFLVFLTEMLYGGTAPSDIKKGLIDSSIYKDVSTFLIKVEPQGEQDAETAAISRIIYSRFTPQYIQSKTEKLLDDSSLWIAHDAAAPVLSFTDIKQDMLRTYPGVDLQSVDTNAEESLEAFAGYPQSGANSLAALAQNDFVVPVGEYFQWIKTFYKAIQILQPILTLLLIGSLILLAKLNDNWPSRLEWIGTTLINAAMYGTGIILFNMLAIMQLKEVTISNPENFLAAFSPILLQLMEIFMHRYAQIQNIVSLIMAITGVFCVIGAVILKQKANRKINSS